MADDPGKRIGAWTSNPWVFAYTFAITRANVDALETAA